MKKSETPETCHYSRLATRGHTACGLSTAATVDKPGPLCAYEWNDTVTCPKCLEKKP